MPAATIAAFCARLSHLGVIVREVRSQPRLLRIVAQSVRQHAADQAYLTELNTWSGRHASLTGVPARNTARDDPAATVPGRAFAGGVLAVPDDAETVEDHAVVGGVGDRQRPRAGVAACR